MNTTSNPTGLAGALRAALQWRLLLLWVLLLLAPTLLIALPTWTLLADKTSNAVDAASMAAGTDVPRIAEALETLGDAAGALTVNAIAAMVLVLLLSPLLTGMVAGTIRGGRRLRFGELLQAGMADYGPMLRMLLWSVIPLGVAIGLGAVAIKGLTANAEHAILASEVDTPRRIGLVLLAVLFVFAHAGVETGRASLGVNGQSRSAIRAWWRGFKLTLRRPVAVLGTCLLTLLAGLVVAALVLLLRMQVDGIGIGGAIIAFLLTQLAVAALCWSRIARLHGLAAIVRRAG